jgi:hypothetical protein
MWSNRPSVVFAGLATIGVSTFALADGPALLLKLPSAAISGSTVPLDGDLNPYGVAFVPPGFPTGGLIKPGDVIVSNFNDGIDANGGGNAQGTGTTIVKVNPNEANPNEPPTLFFQDASFPGFSTALGVLSKGFVIVGHVPSKDGSGVCTEGPKGQEEGVGHGSLLVINKRGRLVEIVTSAALLDGPWDLTVDDFGSTAAVFVSDALNGSVTRLDLRVEGDGDGDRGDRVAVERETRIASGYAHRCDEDAFIVGPTGLALDRAHDVLYVAATADNAIFAVPNAHGTGADGGNGRGRIAVKDDAHLHGPVGLIRAPNGDLISAQGDAVNPDDNHPSEIVEFSAAGEFLSEFSVDATPGSAFGLALVRTGPHAFRFAAVDDGLNVLDVWDFKD